MKIRLLFLVACLVLGRDQLQASFHADIISGDEIHVVSPGSDERIYIQVSNSQEFVGTVHYQCSFKDYYGKQNNLKGQWNWSSGMTEKIEIPEEMKLETGVVWVDFKLNDEAGRNLYQRSDMAFSVMRPTGVVPIKESEMLFGIAYGAGPSNKAPVSAEASALIGVNIARLPINWHRIEPSRGDYRFNSESLAPFEVHARYGIETQALISGTPRWARPKGTKQSHPPSLEDFKTWASKVATELKGRVLYYEIWNEPDLSFFTGTTDEYIELLKTAAIAIRQADPETTILTGGFASLNHGRTKKGMIKRAIMETAEYVDHAAYHKHGLFSQFHSEVSTQLMPIVEASGLQNKGVYFTETGMSTRFGQHVQAHELIKKMAFAWSQGAIAFTWFNLYDHPSPEKANRSYGLRTKNTPNYDEIYPKAAYHAYNTFTKLLGGAHFVEELDVGAGSFGYLFTKGEDMIIVAWHEVRSQPLLLDRLISNQPTIEVFDPMERKQTHQNFYGSLPLALSREPKFFVIRNGKQSWKWQPTSILKKYTHHFLPNEEEVKLQLVLRNPFNQSIDIQGELFHENIVVENNGGFSIKALKAKAEKSLEISLKIKDLKQLKLGSGIQLRTSLEFRINGVTQSQKRLLPVRLNTIVLDPKKSDQNELIRIVNPKLVRNRFEHDPYNEHTVWSNKNDCSATMSFSLTESFLEVKMRVRDDHYIPTNRRLTTGDSINLLIGQSKTGARPISIRFGLGREGDIHQVSPQSIQRDLHIGYLQNDSVHRTWTVRIPVDRLTSRKDTQGVRINAVLYDSDSGKAEVESTISAYSGAFEEQSSSWLTLLLKGLEQK